VRNYACPTKIQCAQILFPAGRQGYYCDQPVFPAEDVDLNIIKDLFKSSADNLEDKASNESQQARQRRGLLALLKKKSPQSEL
jgi:hypothetical protein